ncbi:superfamily I DNA and RNA helicase [Peribacillus simplex]|uniref:DEAD/DEAH box helicase n=1 Tax=Peribacillus simplex TaxID=1478 RepID=UPI0024E1FB4C|nr:UvrD-helicase domain-containing protein [Peribacillus simplex]MDF9763778.1 superfamily I DNA and RNA helicase [Peribacillus simplex]
MTTTYFFSNIEINDKNSSFITAIEKFAEEHAQQIYLIDSPLGEKKYSYSFKEGMILLIPDHKIMILNNEGDEEEYEDFSEDFSEDLGHLSDRYDYKKILGRPRKWKKELLVEKDLADWDESLDEFLADCKLSDPEQKRQIELLISLSIGSINSIDKISENLPQTLLEKVRQNIVLFDGDQTRFIFKRINQRRITIQGLAGTGKTELLLHKIKELYTEKDKNRIAFTCFNKALANSLKNRVPAFFDFMKVEEQIKWGERLWIMHSWGSRNDPTNVGLYSYICKNYGIPFQGLHQANFDKACQNAITHLKVKAPIEPLFDYVLIDESQDFQESFFELCELVTSNTVYVAGDIFQNIFQSNINETSPDFLLNKCYRTDPKTLMFAHSVGFGLFEEKGIRKLSKEQWAACGYNIDEINQGKLSLSRSPLRKFTEIEKSDIDSVKLLKYSTKELVQNLIRTIDEIKQKHSTVGPDDIAIIVMDRGNEYFDLMNYISVKISNEFGWSTNKLHDSKEVRKDRLSISNINNIKGLEFPFIICIANEKIGLNVQKRNALYMTLTRSFITSYLLINQVNNNEICNNLESGLNGINSSNRLIFQEPAAYIDQAELIFDVNDMNLSQRDIVDLVFDAHAIPYSKQELLRRTVQTLFPDSVDRNQIEAVILKNLGFV